MSAADAYAEIVRESVGLAGEELITYWATQLPYFSRDEYLESTLRPTEIMRFGNGTFEYVYDHYTAFEHRGEVPYDAWEEDRLVVACGRSAPEKRRRDDGRLVGWVGRTNRVFGTAWDKGHYIAHSIGGSVDGVEVNVFVQRRDLNRGWSAEGKLYRQMEQYCAAHPKTFCFARPIYMDGTARPAWIDFGLLQTDGHLWAERFDNRWC